jgi:hypothetical protein
MKRTTITLILPFFLLAACSGDGGYTGPGDDNDPPPPPPAGITITSANGVQVTQVAYQSALSAGDIAGLAGNTGLTGDSGGGLAKPSSAQYFDGTVAGILQKVPFGPTVIDCMAGGTMTVTMDLADLEALLAGALTAGDTILNEYASCDEGFGEVIDGTVDSVVDAFNGNILVNIYDFTMTMDLVNFQVATAEDVITVNGDSTAVLNSLAAPYVETSVSGSLITTDTNSSTETLTSYSSAQTLDAGLSPAPYTLNASGTLDSSQLTGAITYSTPVMLEGEDANYPHAGEFLIVGDSSSARLIAQANAVDVVIEIYSNTTGTGTPDDTIMTTWAELAGM